VTGLRTRGRRPNGDQSDLAQQIGTRLRAARLAAGLTQQQLASPRYTKAYVSALENGLSRPSMVALTFFAERLGLPAERFIGNAPVIWARLDADLALAAHHWNEAEVAYRELLSLATARVQRAELLLGRAVALVGMERGAEAVEAATEAGQLFASLGRDGQAELARYWLAQAELRQGHLAEARDMFGAVLGRVRGGLFVEPDFELRLVIALARAAARAGEHTNAVAYLQEVRGLAGLLNNLSRAAYYADLSATSRETGDVEDAIRSGISSLTLYRAAESDFEMAGLANDLALAYLALGDPGMAAEQADDARVRAERLGDDHRLAHVLDTQARIALARDRHVDGVRLAQEALRLAERTSNADAQVDALVTLARAEAAAGRSEEALALYERAATSTRVAGAHTRLREVLAEWADLLANAGEHQRAFELMREAVKDA
jgi:transcriptional regulator with XRE-family HTH domain